MYRIITMYCQKFTSVRPFMSSPHYFWGVSYQTKIGQFWGSSTGAQVGVSAPPSRQRLLSFPQLLGRFWVQIKKIPQKSILAPTRGGHFEFSASKGLVWQNQLFFYGR